ncbi:MAG: acetylxylan esterase [Bacteroidales bacterium]|nr:acetylxylan esterase [Bacteroidales bacterium]
MNKLIFCTLLVFTLNKLFPQTLKLTDTVAGIPVNYDELKTGTYEIPDILTSINGEMVKDTAAWLKQRRPEILNLFTENQFGRSPGAPSGLHFELFDTGTMVYNGKALRKQVTIHYSNDTAGPATDVLVYLPANSKKPVPLLLTINFTANYSIANDSGVRRGFVWNRERQKIPAPASSVFGKLDIEKFINAGFGIATIYYGDIEPDFYGGISHGVRSLYLPPGHTAFGPGEWGAIAAWAWGLGCVMDYFETDKQVDSERIALLGVSRLGKTVLWAGAVDQRFALFIASCSGEGGAALARRNYGETAAHLASPLRYHYQFCGNYKKYSENLSAIPMDSHMLLALLAPRPFLLQTGTTDRWSDPKGEFLAAMATEPVYTLFGKKGLGTNILPEAGKPILKDIGFCMHEGGHGINPEDWDVFLEFMKIHLTGSH